MRCLAIDPGSRAWGWAYYDSSAQSIVYGRETFPAHWSFQLRLRRISELTTSLISRYRPELLVVEMQNHTRNVTTLRRLNEIVGVVMLAGEMHAVPVEEIRITEVRFVLIPKPFKRTKETMWQCLQDQCNGDISFLKQGTAKAPAFDASDAVGMAIFAASLKSTKPKEGALYDRLAHITLHYQPLTKRGKVG